MFFDKSECSVHEVSELLNSPQPPKVLDTREAAEWEIAHLPGSQPLTHELMDQVLNGWDRDGPIVTVCHYGVRSMSMAKFLKQHGFTNVRSMKGGVEAWALEVDRSMPRY